ncbi:MAG: hypothetical protein AAF769_10775 [Pseudomonadota bacterium]
MRSEGDLAMPTHHRRLGALTGALLLAACAQTPPAPTAQTPADEPCNSPAHAALDFWVGDWTVRWTGADGETLQGTNRIDRDAYAGCVVTERFDGRPGIGLQGTSVSVYDVAARTWRQTWVDNQGGYIALTGGPKPDGTFSLHTAFAPDQPRFRMTWSDIRDDSFTWRWQRQQAGMNDWEDRWVIYYSRR